MYGDPFGTCGVFTVAFEAEVKDIHLRKLGLY